MRPYRKVDMGTELEDHGGRLKKLEELRAQVRVVQWLFGALLVTVIGLFVQDCKAKNTEAREQVLLKQKIEAHMRQDHGVDQDTLDSMQTLDKEHGDRLWTIEKRLYIKRKK